MSDGRPTADGPVPSDEALSALLRDRCNWGRWGPDDQMGALNLVTSEKRLEAVRTVRTGRTVSMSRDFPTQPGPANPLPAQHYMREYHFPEGGGASIDYVGISYHGRDCTHIDALCHIWRSDGMWNGRNARDELTSTGSNWCGVDAWSDGIVTRGVLLDVPRLRNVECVTAGRPVHGWELRAAADRQGVEVRSGDALVVYSGRDRYEALHGPWGQEAGMPGLDASCLEFIRDTDCAVVAMDMLDVMPSGHSGRLGVHESIASFGVALVDNCELGAVSSVCSDEDRYEFLLMIAPLVVRGGTGSPVNPIAMF